MPRFLIAALMLVLPGAARGESEADWREKPVPYWIEQLAADQDSPDHVRTRWYATYALGQIGATAENPADLSSAIGPLLDVLADPARDQYEYVRGGAAWALGRIGPRLRDETTTREIVGQLTEVLGPTEELGTQLVSVRRNVPKALGNFGEAAAGAVDRLLEMLGDDDPAVRVHTAVALWKIQRHPRAIPTLTQMAHGDDPRGAFAAVDALGHIGAESEAVLPALIRSLGHRDTDVRRAAARSLGRLGPAVISELRDPLFGTDAPTRRSAAGALGWIGPKAIPALMAVLERSDDPTVRRAAARALGRMGREAKQAEPALVAAVSAPDRDVRETAAMALKKIRTAATP